MDYQQNQISILIKKRSFDQTWGVYHSALGATKYIALNTTATTGTDSAFWNKKRYGLHHNYDHNTSGEPGNNMWRWRIDVEVDGLPGIGLGKGPSGYFPLGAKSTTAVDGREELGYWGGRHGSENWNYNNTWNDENLDDDQGRVLRVPSPLVYGDTIFVAKSSNTYNNVDTGESVTGLDQAKRWRNHESQFHHIEIVEPMEDEDNDFIADNPAIWETEPKEDADLDIYYEASNNIPVRINEKTNELFAPIGCKVEIINATPQQALNDVYLESWDGNKAIFNPGFNRGDGSNEIDYTNTAFKFIRENGSYTVAEAGGQQLIGSLTGIKSDFLFKEDVGDVIGAGLAWYNCFSFGNGLESNRIRDDFNEMFITNGVKASTTTQQTYEEERRSHGLIYSGIYNSNSGINDLNQFIMAEKITKDLNPTYGSIQKLFQRRISLIAFCEDRVVRIISNKDTIFNADGNPQLVASNKVLGDANPFSGEYGISTNPESFASEAYRAYFTDKVRGKVLRLSRDGLTPISEAGMKDWFRDNLKIGKKIIGSYDDRKDDYNVNIRKNKN